MLSPLLRGAHWTPDFADSFASTRAGDHRGGPPWWIYGVAFGLANLVRQVVIILTPAEIPQTVRVASWVATALVVITVINGVALVLRRRSPCQLGHAAALTPASGTGPSTEDPTMTSQHVPAHPRTSIKRAPWWVYLVIILGANYLRRVALPDASTPAARVLVALIFSVAAFVTITVIYRTRRPR